MPITTLADDYPEPYTPVSELETPALLVDVDAMERNAEEYVAFADEQGIDLRSHVKTHKNADIARYQDRISDGGGICCQTLGEAEVMAKNGIDDIYLSYQLVGERKLNRGVWLAERLKSFATTVDNVANTDPLEAAAAERDTTVDVVVEIDLGLNRTGVAPGDPAVELANYVAEAEHLSFQGLLAYDAHVKSEAETQSEFEEYCWEAMELTAETVDSIGDSGLDVQEVKVGGTATSRYSGRHPVVTEINPGMYPFNDVGELQLRPFDVDKEDCAATVITTVISKPSDDRVVVDAGSKSLSLDKPEMPVPKHRDDIVYANASEEHGWIDTSDCKDDIEVGDRLEFIVPHVCTTINLHDHMIGVRDGEVVDVWDVQARGKVR